MHCVIHSKGVNPSIRLVITMMITLLYVNYSLVGKHVPNILRSVEYLAISYKDTLESKNEHLEIQLKTENSVFPQQ